MADNDIMRTAIEADDYEVASKQAPWSTDSSHRATSLNQDALFYMNGADSLVQYEITFPKTPLLPAGESDTSLYAGVPEALEDNIEWEPGVDEADKLDYIVAVSSGVLAGLIDIFYVGDFSFDRASEWGKNEIENAVMRVAHIEGYKGDTLNGAIKFLELKHPLAADGNTNDFGYGLQHHLHDFSHHFSISGLIFSILTQFTGHVVGTDITGALQIVSVPESHRAHIGKNFQEKITFGVIGWFFHMVSDMAGSSGSLMGGTGIPGPLLSFMKELSALPFFKKSGLGKKGFRKMVTKLFNGSLLADRDEKGNAITRTYRRFDLRAEIGIVGEIGRQTMPVLINQCVVRGFYFCRRLAREIRELEIKSITDLERIAPEDVLPWDTPAMRRMITVSSGVFTGVDLADAAVRAIRSKEPVTFFLRVNYVGVATFVIACVAEVREILEDKKLEAGETPEEAYERELSELWSLKLDFPRARVLHSVMREIVAHDIALEKHDKRRERKQLWLDEWSNRIAETVRLAWAADAGYFLDEDEIYEAIENSRDDASWVYLATLEASGFKPYEPLSGENDKDYKGLKLSSDYLADVFCKRQDVLSMKDLRKLERAVSSARRTVDGGLAKRIASGVGIIAVVSATGGAAFYLAPTIAPILATALGANTVALSGAALTSASLAFLGGGALAVGGAGMAGGTMLIAGGGALIGAVGGTGVSAVASMALATNASYVLDECSKLIAFCEEVLLKRDSDTDSVMAIYNALGQRIVELEAQIEAIKRDVPVEEIPDEEDDGNDEDNNTDDKEEISPKKMLKILNRTHKFLKRSRDRLAKSLMAELKKRNVELLEGR